ncbi:MAG: trimethylamine methyltransferase family protein [Proteobacteria bacterium]|nr:trimethylamine methyltransferase family protein [Pseudomonadota bacterium]MBU1697323.1 trimethylamine methyltransferase family protein [Pseudomonadota bacterium]
MNLMGLQGGQYCPLSREQIEIVHEASLKILEQVAKAPEKVVLCGHDPKNDLHLTENRVHLGTGGAAIKILDLETGKVRPTTLKDLYDVSRLVDQLI